MMWASGMCLHKQIWQHSFWNNLKTLHIPMSCHHLENPEIIPSELPPPGEPRSHPQWAATTWRAQRSSQWADTAWRSPEIIPSELPPPGEPRDHHQWASSTSETASQSMLAWTFIIHAVGHSLNYWIYTLLVIVLVEHSSWLTGLFESIYPCLNLN